MRRREFIAFLGVAASAPPFPALAQSGGQRKIAILALGTANNPVYQANVTAFIEGLS